MIKSNLSISSYIVPPHPFADPVFSNVSARCLCLADHLVSMVANPARSGECQAFSGLMSLIFNGRTAEFIFPLFRSEGLVVDRLDRIAVLARSGLKGGLMVQVVTSDGGRRPFSRFGFFSPPES